jgi:deoxyribonuclease V
VIDAVSRLSAPHGWRWSSEAVGVGWPATRDALEREQERIAGLAPPPWEPRADSVVAGCFVCFPRGGEGPGAVGDRAWAAGVAMHGGEVLGHAVIEGAAGAVYEPGLLALREGPLLERAVRGLRPRPDVVLVDATARDHPRGAGLALHLGAVLDVPTVGVTHRPLIAGGDWPAEDHAGAWSPVRVGGAVVAMWLRTRRRVRPLVVHPAWRTDTSTARDVVLAATGRARTPEPLRHARHLARAARAAAA